MGFPIDISEHGHMLDELFQLTLALTGGTFLVVAAILGFFLVKYREKAGRRAVYSHGDSRGALMLTLALSMAVFIFIDLNLAWHDHHVFEKLFGSPPNEEDALAVDVVAEIFSWNFRYPGPDGEFGRIDLARADTGAMDPFGLDAVGDPAGEDDIVSVGELVVPGGRDIVLKMKSRDVIHSLFLPNLRIKQDVVPGLETKLYFRAMESGKHEIACAELCGYGHYKMRGVLTVLEPEEFEAWLERQSEDAFFDEEEFE